jgi:regulator of replication initiation timing
MLREPIVTVENVLKAVRELKDENKAISTRSVRKKLGAGNLTQISAILKQVMDEAAASAKISVQAGEQYKEIINAVVSASSKLVEDQTKALVHEKNMLAEEVDECNDNIMSLHQQIGELKSYLSEMIDKNKSLEAKNEAILDENNKLKNIFDEQLKEHRKTFQDQLSDKNETVKALQVEREELREKLSEALASATKDASYYKGLHEGAKNVVQEAQKNTKK